MQSLFIRHKICQKYSYARDFLKFSLFNALKCQTFWNPQNIPIISEQLIKLYNKTLELQVFYLSPLEECSLKHIFEILNYFYFFKMIKERPSFFDLEDNENEHKLLNQFDLLSKKISDYCYSILKICLIELFRLYEYLKKADSKNTFVILLQTQLETFFIFPLKNIQITSNSIKNVGGSLNKIDFELIEKYNHLNYSDYLELKNKILDINRLIFYNFKICFEIKDKCENYNIIMKKILITNNRKSEGVDSFLYMALSLQSIESSFFFSKSSYLNIFVENDFENLIPRKIQIEKRYDIVNYLLNFGAKPDILTNNDEKSDSFLNYSLFENNFFSNMLQR
jgi:hypothetical protein